MAVISGVLKGPMGDARVGVVIELRAVRTSATVVIQARSQSITDATGRYTLSVEPGQYDVMITAAGRQPERVGGIHVMVNSATGTLNDFLTIPGESDLNPEIVATVDRMRADTAASAAAAKVSENNAAASANDTVKKSVTILQAMSGALTVTDAVSVSAKSDVSNANLFFTNSDKAETNAIFSSAAGQMSIRVGKGGYSNVFDPNGFFEPSAGIRLSSRTFSYTDIQGSTGSTPFSVNGYVLRGKDLAGFSDLNNINLCSWNGVGFVPVTTASLGPGVEQGKPSVYIDTRSGKVNSIGGFYTNSVAMLKAGEFGIGGVTPYINSDTAMTDIQTMSTGIYVVDPSPTNGMPTTTDSYCINWNRTYAGKYGLAFATALVPNNSASQGVYRNRLNGSTFQGWVKIWDQLNTTVDANGFIKKASPIIKLFGTGESELNDQSQGVTTERVSEGVYRISGTLGFNADAEWGGVDGGIEIPTDRNKLPLVWVDYEVDATGDLLVKTFHRVNATAPKFAQNVKAGYKEGQPIDIPAGRWIDLRVEMPGGDDPEYVPEPEGEVPEFTPEVTEPEGSEEPKE